MEALNFFKLWRTSPAAAEDLIPPPAYDDEDSFFDLELNYEPNHINQSQLIEIETSESDDDDELFRNSPKIFESRSPISFLRSPTKIPFLFMFRKKTDSGGGGGESPVAAAAASPIIRRVNSSGRKIQRYLKRMQVRVSRSSSGGGGEFLPESPSRKAAEDREGMRSPSLRIVGRRLGKSRAAVTGGRVAAAANVSGGDMVLQSDGIQGAILHCKRSYNSSRDLSVLSRSVSEPVISANPSRFSIEEKKRNSI